MKHVLALFLTLTILLGSLPSCGQNVRPLTAQPVSVSPENSKTVNQALANFGVSLLQNVREIQGTSVLISPLSVTLALSMAANGAEGDTLTQFEKVLGGGVPLTELNAACAQLLLDYKNLGGSTECSIANSLWADPEGKIREDFIGECQGIFDSQVFSQELSAPSVVPAVNGWVSDHTNKMIPSILDRPFSEYAALLLVSALYLNNTWETEFDPNNTCLHEFYHQGTSKETIDFLNIGFVRFPYLQGEGAQGVILPYDDGRLAFFALMPDEGTRFERWLGTLNGEALTQILKNPTDTEFLTLALPKFEAEWNGQLQDILSAIGLDLVFDEALANFSLLGNNPNGYYLSQVIHAAKIEVNEKGTEAAAATVVEATSGSAAPPQTGISLIFNRPFLYGIVDLENGAPLFLGTFE